MEKSIGSAVIKILDKKPNIGFKNRKYFFYFIKCYEKVKNTKIRIIVTFPYIVQHKTKNNKGWKNKEFIVTK